LGWSNRVSNHIRSGKALDGGFPFRYY